MGWVVCAFEVAEGLVRLVWQPVGSRRASDRIREKEVFKGVAPVELDAADDSMRCTLCGGMESWTKLGRA